MDSHSSPAHSGKLENAVDFLAHENTVVLAAADGTITYVKDDSYIGCPSVNFWARSIFISMKHQNEEYTRYDHLAFGSSKVKVGGIVSAGEQIAKVGMTGGLYLSAAPLFPSLCFHRSKFMGRLSSIES